MRITFGFFPRGLSARAVRVRQSEARLRLEFLMNFLRVFMVRSGIPGGLNRNSTFDYDYDYDWRKAHSKFVVVIVVDGKRTPDLCRILVDSHATVFDLQEELRPVKKAQRRKEKKAAPP